MFSKFDENRKVMAGGTSSSVFVMIISAGRLRGPPEQSGCDDAHHLNKR